MLKDAKVFDRDAFKKVQLIKVYDKSGWLDGLFFLHKVNLLELILIDSSGNKRTIPVSYVENGEVQLQFIYIYDAK